MVFNAIWEGWLTADDDFNHKVKDEAPEEVKKAYNDYIERMKKEGMK